jgi:serine/threonine protein kinase
MDPSIYRKVEKIYYSVLDSKTDDVEAFITEATNGNQNIIDKVKSLLAVEEYDTYNQTSENILSTFSEIISDHAGGFESERYQLLKKIGEGGMGLVYLAKRIDQEVEQKVAIKIINLALATKEDIERFKIERQILATLDHKNIARFIDAGTTETGLLFVVMEYIEGITLKQYCQIRKLNINHILLLFIQLSEAIEYAHRHFIIHRDIKPTNILVNKQGEIKLLDFGIAKLVDKEPKQMITTVTKIMTPAYASPEQLLGKKVTVQSDVYALGVVLFEVVIGHRPYQKYEPETHKFQLKVINGINVKPSQLHNIICQDPDLEINKHVISNDIDAILTKVINPNLSHRYQSVFEFRQDIDNYLNGFPVKARTPNFWYFSSLFIKRNKLVTALSSITLVVIIGFSVYSYLQNIKLIQQGKELTIQRDEAIRQANRAKMASDFLLDSFQTADPTRTFGENLTIKKVIQESFEKLKNQPLTDQRLSAELYSTISDAFYGMRSIDLAYEAANQGLSIITESTQLAPLIQVKLQLAKAKYYYAKKDFEASLKDLSLALEICNKNTAIEDCLQDDIYLYMAKNQFVIGNDNIAINHINESLKWMDERKIAGIRYAKNLLVKAGIENDMELPENALTSIDKLKSIISLENKVQAYDYLTAEVLSLSSLFLLKRYDEAVKKSKAVTEKIVGNFGKENGLYIKAINIRAILHKRYKEYEQTIKLFKESIQIKKKLKINHDFEESKLGNLYYYVLKDYPLAIKHFKEAIRLDLLNASNKTSASGFYRRELALSYYYNNNSELALRQFLAARDIFVTLSYDYSETIAYINQWIEYLEAKKLEK